MIERRPRRMGALHRSRLTAFNRDDTDGFSVWLAGKCRES
jgi:hypothetical protein